MLGILAAMGIAAWAVLDAPGGMDDAPTSSADALALAELEAENERLRAELERLRAERALTAQAPERKGPRLEGNREAPPTRAHETQVERERRLLREARKATMAAAMANRPKMLAIARDTNKSDVERIAALSNLRHAGAPELQQVILDLLHDEGTSPRLMAAAFSMLAVPEGGGVPAVVTQLLDDPDAPLEVRAGALRIQMRAQPHAAEPEFRRLLLSDDPDERKHGISLLKYARDRTFKPAVEEALRYATSRQEQQGLITAIAGFKGKNWATYQMTGPPDTPIGGDLGTAWASKTGDMGDVWVELEFRHSVVPSDVRIHETYNAGAVKQILARQPGGRWTVLWEGMAPRGDAPRWFEPRIDVPRHRSNTIRIVLDTNRVAGWNEIDAVELVGDGSRQWAVKARASSSYAGE